ncbi:STIP1 y and U box-containing protein 1 [Actinomortierella ambigua]|uniref:RING-type E3 ubiquitin transferase n=1 Tax=Actinomortierella ambigua TaxID=1343610 RepID=A0A9P6QN24_9FUNG|nr:STIP1 y and U box-containing protein 1 [Actinomortierella ambigua]
MSHSLTADQHKQLGNEHFKKKEYEEAITEYSRAIVKDPRQAVYYTNRANCYLKLDKYQNVINDCERAIEFEPKSSYEFAQGQQSGFAKEIIGLIQEAKKQKWIELERARIAEVSGTYRYMKGLIDDDFKRRALALDKESPLYAEEVIELGQEKEDRLRQLDHMLQRAGEPDEYAAPYLQRSTGASNTMPNGHHDAPKLDGSEHHDDLKKASNKWPRKNLAPRVVPDHFLDKITFEFMHDPVISIKSGISYERKMMQEHFSYGRMFDPIAQVPMTERDLIPNRALKDACEAYLAENGWAVDY